MAIKRIMFALGFLLLGCSIDAPKTEGSTTRKMRIASFLPENNYHERVNYQSGEVTEQDFNDVIDAAREIYDPIFNGLGLTLTINGSWDDNTVNAYCNRQGDDVEVSMFGGLARHKNMSREGFALVLCHEIGHAIAGIPVYSNSPWFAAVEGQSDYYATASCAKKMFDPNSPFGYELMRRRKPNPDQSENTTCNSEVCKLSLTGGLSLGSVLADLSGEKMPSYNTPSKVVVKKTMEKHPPAQCRLDSYKAGALCDKIWNDSIIPSTKEQERAVSCAKPHCWYAN